MNILFLKYTNKCKYDRNLFEQMLPLVYENVILPKAMDTIQNIQNNNTNKKNMNELIAYLPFNFWETTTEFHNGLKQLVSENKKCLILDKTSIDNNVLYLLYCHNQGESQHDKYYNQNIELYNIKAKTYADSTKYAKQECEKLYSKFLKYKMNQQYKVNSQYSANNILNQDLQNIIQTGINIFGAEEVMLILTQLLIDDKKHEYNSTKVLYSNVLLSKFSSEFMKCLFIKYGKDKAWKFIWETLLNVDLQDKIENSIKLCSISSNDINKYMMDNMYFDDKNNTIYIYNSGLSNQFSNSLVCKRNEINNNIIELYVPVINRKDINNIDTMESYIPFTNKEFGMISNSVLLNNDIKNDKYMNENTTTLESIPSDIMNNYFKKYGPKLIYKGYILRRIQQIINNNTIINDGMKLFEITEDDLQSLIKSGAINHIDNFITTKDNEKILMLEFKKYENNNYSVLARDINSVLSDNLYHNIANILNGRNIELNNNTLIPIFIVKEDNNHLDKCEYEINQEISIYGTKQNNLILKFNRDSNLCNTCISLNNISSEDKSTINNNITKQLIKELSNEKIEKLHKKQTDIVRILKINNCKTILADYTPQELQNFTNNICNCFEDKEISTMLSHLIKIVTEIFNTMQYSLKNNKLQDNDKETTKCYYYIINRCIQSLLQDNIKLKRIKEVIKNNIIQAIESVQSQMTSTDIKFDEKQFIKLKEKMYKK
ncbi:MAG: hypothetical protein IJ848_04195 [Alphaproteobacteria bacterium]|nr:hypothetical protein [Alphaproteobacteria bacterium]